MSRVPVVQNRRTLRNVVPFSYLENKMKFSIAVLPLAISSIFALAQTSPAPIQLQHIDVTRVESSVNPCDNFYEYTCSRLDKENPIPADQAGVDRAAPIHSGSFPECLRRLAPEWTAPVALVEVRLPNRGSLTLRASCVAFS